MKWNKFNKVHHHLNPLQIYQFPLKCYYGIVEIHIKLQNCTNVICSDKFCATKIFCWPRARNQRKIKTPKTLYAKAPYSNGVQSLFWWTETPKAHQSCNIRINFRFLFYCFLFLQPIQKSISIIAKVPR